MNQSDNHSSGDLAELLSRNKALGENKTFFLQILICVLDDPTFTILVTIYSIMVIIAGIPLIQNTKYIDNRQGITSLMAE